MNLLVVGDSFAADWSQHYPGSIGWPNLLAEEFSVTNLAQAGCSEYRIYKQLQSVDLKSFDCIIVSHTSPYRIYTEYHPARRQLGDLHEHCDLLYSDVCHLASIDNIYLSVQTYFEKFFSLEYASTCFDLLRKQITLGLSDLFSIEIAHIESQDNLDINFYKVYDQHSGLINHYSAEGNQIVFQELKKRIQS